MSQFVRKVKTSSGATAVQIVEKIRGQRKILEHIGSAHTEGELAALIAVARGKITAGQQPLELGLEPEAQVRSGGDAVVRRHSSELLWQTLSSTFDALGFNAVADETFKALVCARLIEPTSKLDTPRVLDDIGVDAPHLSSIKRALARCVERDYRTALATACWEHVTSAGGPGVALVLYDLTTLYFEAEKEDSLRKVGMSKERRVDPQITVGLLVARDGFPLDIHVFEGNRAETKTLIPVITAFQQRHQISDMVVVADAGMLSAASLNALEGAGLSFIVASRTSKAPKELEASHDPGLTPPARRTRARAGRAVVAALVVVAPSHPSASGRRAGRTTGPAPAPAGRKQARRTLLPASGRDRRLASHTLPRHHQLLKAASTPSSSPPSLGSISPPAVLRTGDQAGRGAPHPHLHQDGHPTARLRPVQRRASTMRCRSCPTITSPL
ncbi:IS1634 family transposase [Dietzia kunjamensis]|nr:IS1634 family transposase [Dietzia kunjamensis]USX45189.1 IS1634 family transposase [Dietzia kunjamensis]